MTTQSEAFVTVKREVLRRLLAAVMPEILADGVIAEISALEQPGVKAAQIKSPCARQCEVQAFKIEIRQLARLVADYMEIIAKQRVAMKEAHRVLGTLDVSITSRTLGARCGLADAMKFGISAPQPAQQPQLLTDDEINDLHVEWFDDFDDFARAIEAEVLKKNGVLK